MADRSWRTVACTVVAQNYLPAARVLARSYRQHHPDHDMVIAVIDGPRGAVEEAHALVVGPDWFDVDPDEYLRMATAYSLMELATAVKPFLLRRLRRRAEVVLYLDPDIQVFAPFGEITDLATAHAVVLTPHTLEPIPRDGMEPGEAVIMGTGIFNLGFVAVGQGSEAFLDYWAERLRHDAIVAPEQQLFTDQRWVDQVPALFRHHVVRDPGCNVAYWNVWQRPIGQDAAGRWTAGGYPLRFFHFSGYRPEKPWLLTLHCARRPRTVLSEHPTLRELCDGYRRALLAQGYTDRLETVPYGFARLGDGTPLTRTMRRVFRAGWIEAERSGQPVPPHPFGEDGGAGFREWLTSPADVGQAAAGLHRWAMAVWSSRADLQVALPRPWGDDAAGYRFWCRKSGIAEGELAEWASPAEPEAVPAPEDAFGVNLLGYLTAELGLGEMGRIVHEALEAAGVPVASVVEEHTVSNRTSLRRPATLGRPRFPVSIVAVNADQTRAVLAAHPEVGQGRYRIGLWAWELEDFPAWLHDAFDLVDEVWTVSEFCREALARYAPVPVRAIPVPVRDPGEPVARARRPGDPVRFLFVFDFNSVGQRKNPWGLVEAFRRAFDDDDRSDVRLVIKTINAGRHPDAAERLRSLVAADDRIELLERYLTVGELEELYARSDCYVSLHRSEGFGLTVAEAMARGLPTIATDYSATTELMTAEVGWPVPYRLVAVGAGNQPYHPDARWAEPDLDAAARAMREVADDPAEAARRGRAAREHLLATRTMDAAANWLRDAVEQARQRWRLPRSVPPPAVGSPLEPLRTAREALRWRADVAAPSRTPFASAVRRAVLRAIDHYDVHQRRVLSALADGAEGTAERLAAETGALRRDLDNVVGTRLAALQRSVQQHDEAMRSLERSLGERLEQLRDVVSALQDSVEEENKRTFDRFLDRDRRCDQIETDLGQARRDVGAAHAALVAQHPVPPEDATAVVCDAGVLLLPVDDEVVLPWLRYHRSWETEEAELMARLAGGGVFLDVGAHVGYHTLRLLQDGAATRAIAVEAHPGTAELLRRNVQANVPTPAGQKVVVLPVAAWDTNGEVVLRQVEPGNSGDYRADPALDPALGRDGLRVPAVRLAERPEVRAQPIGLVKVDLQGRDHRALAGLAEVLLADRPHVVCEFSPEAVTELGDDPLAVLAGYRELGYEIRDLSGVALSSDRATLLCARRAEAAFLTLWLTPSRS